MIKKNNYIANAGLLLTAVIWGFAFVVVKESLDKISPLYMLAFRFSIAGIGLCIIFLKRLSKINLRIACDGVILGFLIFVSYAVQTYGCKYTDASKNAFLTAIYVILVPFIYWATSKKRPNALCFIAAVLAITGTGMLTLSGDETGVNFGDFLTMLCSIGYAVHMIITAKFARRSDPVLLTVIQILTAAVLSWIFAVIFEGGVPIASITASEIGGMLYLGLMSTMTAFLLQTVCQKYTSPSAASVLLSSESVFGAVFSFIFIEGVPSVKTIFGCIIVFAAIVMSQVQSDQ